MSILELFQSEEGFLYENIGFILVYAVLFLIIGFGIKMIHDGYKIEKDLPQREYFIGLGLFILSVAIGEGIYLMDLVVRSHLNVRVFLPLTDSGEISWQSIVGYELASLIDRDYYVVVFIILFIALSFLMKPLEKVLLKRERAILTMLNRIFIPVPLIIRILEVNFHSLFGIQVLENSVPFYVFFICWIVVLGILACSVIILIGLYLKMAITAPQGSSLKKKSIMIILGLALWVLTIFLTSRVLHPSSPISLGSIIWPDVLWI